MRLVVPLFLVGLQAQPAAPIPPEPSLLANVNTLIAKSGAEVAVAFRTLDGEVELLVRPDVTFHAASTMKVPIMIELYRQAHAGLLSLDEPLAVRNEFRSIVDGSAYALVVGDDSEAGIYRAIGRTRTLRQLCDAMITVSSNLAANLLIERVGVENVRRTVSGLGADGMQVLRGVEDAKAFHQGLNNTTTARGLLVLLEKLARGEAVGPAVDREMIGILTRQTFRDAIPAGLPAGMPVAHKTGSITRIHHDAAIVFGPRPFVLVVLVRGIDDRKTSAALIASLARRFFQAATETADERGPRRPGP
jgi:beta-lactamase class A